MSGLTIAWEYLTGRCVAMDPASRQRAEWPPHPGRVFMAMAAAWFETGEDEAEGQALRWLETLGDPELALPEDWFARKVVDYYLPVNDVAGPSTAIIQSAPGLTRDRKEKTFPSVWVGDAPCFLHWPNVDSTDVTSHRSALDQLCGKVTRIGHPSSLVQMWLPDEVASPRSTQSWVPDDGLAVFQARRIAEGMLDLLDRQFNRRGRQEFGLLAERIAALKAERMGTKGKGAQERKAVLDGLITEEEARLELFDNRDPIRPTLGLWTGYRQKEDSPPTEVPHSEFDSDVLILSQRTGPRLPLVSSLAVTRALRGAVMSHIGGDIPEWASGHQISGGPLRGNGQHLACLPLPFVGTEHADGHLLGVAIVFPRGVARRDRGRVLGSLLVDPSGKPRPITLTLGALGVWVVEKRDWTETRKALQPEAWTAYPRGARTWASVTPIVLDQFPKRDPIREREAWLEEVEGMMATACVRIGLPAPIEVRVGTTSWHLGSPRASVKRRPLRGHSELANASASFGDGFPIYPSKGGAGARPQLHVCIRFVEPVVGPLLLGAGRFLGYGLCKPLREEPADE